MSKRRRQVAARDKATNDIVQNIPNWSMPIELGGIKPPPPAIPPARSILREREASTLGRQELKREDIERAEAYTRTNQPPVRRATGPRMTNTGQPFILQAVPKRRVKEPKKGTVTEGKVMLGSSPRVKSQVGHLETGAFIGDEQVEEEAMPQAPRGWI